MRILINRESVCMGDDIDSHELIIDVDDGFNFKELFRYIINIGYLPNVWGNDVVWVMEYGKRTEIAVYQTATDLIFTAFIGEIPLVKNWIDNSKETVYLRYYSSREKRAKQIFLKYAGNAYHIWHEGFSEEYKSYHITKEKENNWRTEL